MRERMTTINPFWNKQQKIGNTLFVMNHAVIGLGFLILKPISVPDWAYKFALGPYLILASIHMLLVMKRIDTDKRAIYDDIAQFLPKAEDKYGRR
jgi:hypothetical protein